jgi:hypothetical protein
MTDTGSYHRPYGDEAKDFLYNLLFCDNRELFRPREGEPLGPLAVIMADIPDVTALRQIAADTKEESRYRALAFNRLREAGAEVPVGVLLGTIVENAMEDGLDVLAVFHDRRVRYFNHAAPPAIFEVAPEDVSVKAAELVMRSQSIVDKIGPWYQQRLPPPVAGNLRLTFVVSDGLYFGEGPFEVFAQDHTARAVVGCAIALLNLVVEFALKK